MNIAEGVARETLRRLQVLAGVCVLVGLVAGLTVSYVAMVFAP